MTEEERINKELAENSFKGRVDSVIDAVKVIVKTIIGKNR